MVIQDLKEWRTIGEAILDQMFDRKKFTFTLLSWNNIKHNCKIDLLKDTRIYKMAIGEHGWINRIDERVNVGFWPVINCAV